MAAPKCILGRKVGMTQVFGEDGARIGVTVIEAGPCKVLQVKAKEAGELPESDQKGNVNLGRKKGKKERARNGDGYYALQLGFGAKKAKNTSNAELGHVARSGGEPRRFVREVRLDGPAELKAGDDVTVSIFDGVKKVDVIGTSKGKGFAGVMKRHNFSGQRASHGNSKNHRTGGGLGRHMSTNKGVPKGKRMAGHMGDVRVTVQGLKLVKADAEKNLLMVQGSVPGANGSFVLVRHSIQEAVRLHKAKAGKK